MFHRFIRRWHISDCGNHDVHLAAWNRGRPEVKAKCGIRWRDKCFPKKLSQSILSTGSIIYLCVCGCAPFYICIWKQRHCKASVRPLHILFKLKRSLRPKTLEVCHRGSGMSLPRLRRIWLLSQKVRRDENVNIFFLITWLDPGSQWSVSGSPARSWCATACERSPRHNNLN